MASNILCQHCEERCHKAFSKSYDSQGGCEIIAKKEYVNGYRYDAVFYAPCWLCKLSAGLGRDDEWKQEQWWGFPNLQKDVEQLRLKFLGPNDTSANGITLDVRRSRG